MYFKKMIGEKCYLSPISVEDAEQYTAWLNDYEITQYLTLASMQISLPAEKEALSRLSKEHNYAIVAKQNDSLIGNCGLINVDHLHRTAEIGIFIGDKQYLGKGYGREALSLLIDYAFSVLNLHNIMLRVYAFNERAKRSYESVGFKMIGKRRNALIRNRITYDMYLMDLLPEDFYSEKDT
jgi:RimJ/RimL family protein N-acetyltransferase